MIDKLSTRNFRFLDDYDCLFDEMNILVGVNNSGKSTILDAFRILQAALHVARHTTPKLISPSEDVDVFGYLLPKTRLPVSVDNISTNLNEADTSLEFIFQNQNRLFINFPRHGTPYIEARLANGRMPSKIAEFNKLYTDNVYVIPTLGPLEHEEEHLNAKYVERWAASRRAPRLFRNVWLNDPSEFPRFKELVESTWQHVLIEPPRLAATFRLVEMFFSERRLDRPDMIDREVAWAGYGFQVWLQLMTHLVRAGQSDTIIIDEPEIYLHPDLQKRLISVVRQVGRQVVLATHSVEIINEALPEEIVLVQAGQSARRLDQMETVQTAVKLLGSTQNLELSRLAQAKNVLFVEGKTDSLFNSFARLSLEDGRNLPWITVPLGGFGEWKRAYVTDWAFDKIVHQPLKLAMLLDRDYRCEEEIDEILHELRKKHVNIKALSRKEIENYLLVPKPIVRAVRHRLGLAGRDQTITVGDVQTMLDEISQEMRRSVFSQLCANSVRYHRKHKSDASEVIGELLETFELRWKKLDERLCMVPGKELLARLGTRIQQSWRVSVSDRAIIQNMKPSEVPTELVNFFRNL